MEWLLAIGAVWMWLIIGAAVLYRYSPDDGKAMSLFESLGAIAAWPFWLARQVRRRKHQMRLGNNNVP